MRSDAPPAVKICGVCDPADAAMAVEAGASYVGVIRVPGGRRTQPAERARAISAAAAGARSVGVYVDASGVTILEEAEELGLDVIQLHGTEPADRIEDLRARGLEVWKVLKPATADELLREVETYAAADLLLIEGRSPRAHGGVGAKFPWAALEQVIGRLGGETRIGVGGGLDPDNVAEAVRRFRPALVDVSSGVEAELCVKDPERVRAFIDAAKRAGREQDASG